MKKQIALALTAALLAFPVTPGLVMADTEATVQNQDGKTVDPGTLPDSPLYWFQTLIEKVQVALTFDPVKKADLVGRQACENLAEAEALIEKGDTEKAEETLTVYSEKIEQAQAFLDQLEDPGSEAAQRVQDALTQVNTQNIVVLGGLLEKLPPQAAQRTALNIVRSLEKAVAKAEKMENRDNETTDSGTNTEVTNSNETEDQTALHEQAKQALEQFQVDLGLKKEKNAPNGNAYGYDKNNEVRADKSSDLTQCPTKEETQQQETLQHMTEKQDQNQESRYAPDNALTKEKTKNMNKSEKERNHRD